VVTGSNLACLISSDQSLRCEGFAYRVEYPNATPEVQAHFFEDPFVPDTNWIQLSADPVNSAHTYPAYGFPGRMCGIQSNGSLWCWDPSPTGLPEELLPGSTWKSVASSAKNGCAIRADGEYEDTLWCWGTNANGILGVDTSSLSGSSTPGWENTGATTPFLPVGGDDTTWLQVATGYKHACAIRSDQSLWCWGGSNTSGQLGISDESSIALGAMALPQQVTGHTDWTHIATGRYHSCGLREDASMWCWGNNVFGQLGVEAEDTGVPVEIPGSK